MNKDNRLRIKLKQLLEQLPNNFYIVGYDEDTDQEYQLPAAAMAGGTDDIIKMRSEQGKIFQLQTETSSATVDSADITSGKLFGVPIYIPFDMEIAQIGFIGYETQARNTQLVTSIYTNAAGDVPGNKIFQSGQQSFSFLRLMMNNVNMLLTKGIYWICGQINDSPNIVRFKSYPRSDVKSVFSNETSSGFEQDATNFYQKDNPYNLGVMPNAAPFRTPSDPRVTANIPIVYIKLLTP